MKNFISLVCDIARETIDMVCSFILVQMVIEAVFGNSDN